MGFNTYTVTLLKNSPAPASIKPVAPPSIQNKVRTNNLSIQNPVFQDRT